jgi:hypothetical protein
MMSIELFESVLAVVGVVLLRFILFLAVVFALSIPVGIVVKSAEAIGRWVRGSRAAKTAAASPAPAKVIR